MLVYDECAGDFAASSFAQIDQSVIVNKFDGADDVLRLTDLLLNFD